VLFDAVMAIVFRPFLLLGVDRQTQHAKALTSPFGKDDMDAGAKR